MLVVYPRTYKGEEITWVETDTTYFSTARQCTPLWDELHTGALSASRISTYLGLSKFSETSEESALQCVGLSKKSFNSDQLDCTQIGVRGEPILRDWYSKIIGQPIEEVGIAIWKKDTRIRASLDGVYGDKRSVEFKITSDIYWPLIEHFRAMKNGTKPPPSKYEHIWTTHYNQMIQSMAVTGRTSMDYIVAGYKKNIVYMEEIPFDEKYWTTDLYPEAVNFYGKYIEPLMKEKDIKRIDPWIIDPANTNITTFTSNS